MEEEKIKKEEPKVRIHRILANSYMTYLVALVFGLIFSAFWPFKFIENSFLINISGIVLIGASLLILWAQKSSRKFKKEEESLKVESFMKGPYRFTRNPTNLGLFFSMICFGIIINSLFIIFFVLIAFLLSRIIFLKNEEALLEKKYGEIYLEYKKIVKF